MSEQPTTEPGRWLQEQEPYLTTWAWGGMGTPIILAIEMEGRVAGYREGREEVWNEVLEWVEGNRDIARRIRQVAKTTESEKRAQWGDR